MPRRKAKAAPDHARHNDDAGRLADCPVQAVPASGRNLSAGVKLKVPATFLAAASATKQDESDGPAGPLRALIDRLDWSATPLGDAYAWSPVRKRIIDLALGSDVAIMTLWGTQGIMIYNDACARLAGHHHPQMLGMPVGLAPPPIAALSLSALERVHAGDTLVFREQEMTTGRSETDEEIWLDLCCTPILDERGDVDGVFCVISETTAQVLERREVENTLRQSQKMEAIGQLTGGIAHDFNNLLTGIIGNLDMLATRIAQRNIRSASSYLEGARSAATRAAGLTQRLLAFSRRQILLPDVVAIPALLEDMNELLGHTVGPGIDVHVSWQPDVWPAFCDRNQLENALLNLAINARDAMPGGGTLALKASNSTPDEPRPTENHAAGDYVMLEITDSGTGMSQDVIHRAFDPFFTTKPAGQGTGLGLSMVYGFIRQSEGQIDLTSRPGDGTTVRLYIPRYRKNNSALLPAAAKP